MTETLRPQPGPEVLVGREEERGLLSRALEAATRGVGACVLIEGPAGIGKSRLAREAAALANARGFMTLIGASFREDRGAAYTPIIDGLRDLGRRQPGSQHVAVRRLLDLLIGFRPDREGNVSPTTTQQADLARTTDAVLQLLDEVPAGTGSLVVIEDVHWADHATMRLLAAISRHMREMRSVLVLTYRDDEIADSDVLGEVLHALNSGGVSVHTLRLRALTWSETRAMTQVELGIDWLPPTAFVDTLFSRAEGNPFFTQQILRALSLSEEVGRPDLRIPDQMPVSVTRLLEHRIKRLSERGVRVLATAAVLGRRFDQTTVLHVSDISQRTLRKVFHDAVDAHLIRDSGDGETLEFQHALVREAAEGMLLSSERKELHQRVAEDLETRATPSADSAAIAYHYGQAGMKDRVRHHAVAAADDAWRAGAPVEAARWYEQALDASAACGEELPEAVLRRAADAFAAARLTSLASDTFDRLIERQRARGDVIAEAETITELASLFPGDFARWTKMLRHALQILEPLGETAALARAYGQLSHVYVVTSAAREAIETGRMARDIAKKTGAIDAEAVGRRSLGTIVAAGGDLEAGYRSLKRSIELSKLAYKHTDVYLASVSLLNAAIRASDWVLAEKTASESVDYARKLGTGQEAGVLMARFAELLRFTGRMKEAQTTIDNALLLLDEDELHLFHTALLVKAEVLADLGQWHEVQVLIEPMLQGAEREGQFHIFGGALFLLARASNGEGRGSEARGLIERTLSEWRKTQDNYYCLPMLLFACRIACEAGELAAARSLIVELQGVFARTPLCSATIPAAEAHLAVAEGRLSDAIRLWGESAASFDELGRRIDAARARLELGRTLLARRGAADRDEARRQLVDVQRVAGGLPEAGQADALLRRHRLVAASPRRADSPLSEREWEIVALIARGLTNRRIATELTLSARTVDNHVSRILGKLQLESRSQIVAYAMGPGGTDSKPVK